MTAQTAAREIAESLLLEGWFGSSSDASMQAADQFAEDISPRIQQAIDEAVKEERERSLALAMKWRTNTRADPFVKQLARPFIEALESLTGGSP